MSKDSLAINPQENGKTGSTSEPAASSATSVSQTRTGSPQWNYLLRELTEKEQSTLVSNFIYLRTMFIIVAGLYTLLRGRESANFSALAIVIPLIFLYNLALAVSLYRKILSPGIIGIGSVLMDLSAISLFIILSSPGGESYLAFIVVVISNAALFGFWPGIAFSLLATALYTSLSFSMLWPDLAPLGATAIFTRDAFILAIGFASAALSQFHRSRRTQYAGLAWESQQLRQKAEDLAITDELTGVFNYREFRTTLITEFQRSQRYHTDFSIILLDLDNLKKINDTYGHLAGDRALKEIASILKASTRAVDKVFRTGGDEFTVLLPHTRIAEAETVAKRVKAEVSSSTIFQDKNVSLRVSQGISTFSPDLSSWDDMYNRADKALYKGKTKGGNLIVSWNKDISSSENLLLL